MQYMDRIPSNLDATMQSTFLSISAKSKSFSRQSWNALIAKFCTGGRNAQNANLSTEFTEKDSSKT